MAGMKSYFLAWQWNELGILEKENEDEMMQMSKFGHHDYCLRVSGMHKGLHFCIDKGHSHVDYHMYTPAAVN